VQPRHIEIEILTEFKKILVIKYNIKTKRRAWEVSDYTNAQGMDGREMEVKMAENENIYEVEFNIVSSSMINIFRLGQVL